MKQLYTIEPILEERIWGGRGLIDRFHLETDLANVAEIYFVIAISGHLDCMVKETNQPLSQFYQTNKDSLFGCQEEQLPIRMVAGHSIRPLSIQVHPDDAYGLAHDRMLGKPEGELLLGDGEGEMYLGHYAKSKEEFEQMAIAKDWEHLLRKIKVKGGDYINIPAGTLHGSIGEGMCVAFSRNGDVTYRLHDYDRVDDTGKPRQLHVQQVIDVVTVPDDTINVVPTTKQVYDGYIHTLLYDEANLYTCGRLQVETYVDFDLSIFYFISCIEGEGTIDHQPIKAGQTRFVPCGFGPVHLEGNMDLVYISYHE